MKTTPVPLRIKYFTKTLHAQESNGIVALLKVQYNSLILFSGEMEMRDGQARYSEARLSLSTESLRKPFRGVNTTAARIAYLVAEHTDKYPGRPTCNSRTKDLRLPFRRLPRHSNNGSKTQQHKE